MIILPTLKQYEGYRADRRRAVRRIVAAIQSDTVPKSEWALSTIRRIRAEHSASIARQHYFGSAS